jgi:hypothetical protein
MQSLRSSGDVDGAGVRRCGCSEHRRRLTTGETFVRQRFRTCRRSSSVALRYCPRRSHLVQASRTMSVACSARAT